MKHLYTVNGVGFFAADSVKDIHANGMHIHRASIVSFYSERNELSTEAAHFGHDTVIVHWLTDKSPNWIKGETNRVH